MLCGVQRWIELDQTRTGSVEFQGTKKNNIYVFGQPQAFTPFVDPNETDPSRRYKSAVNSIRIDTALAHSADGLTWKMYRDGGPITGRASDTISQVLWDPFARVYRLYTRTDYGTGKTGEVRGTRDMVAAEDADLSDPKSWRTVREWSLGWETKPPVIAGSARHGRGRDPNYHRKRQLYSVNGWVHEDVQFALIWALETGPNGNGLRETMNAYLATARGERPWNLDWIYQGKPLIPLGTEGRFDCRWIQPAPTIVTWRNKHWLYYSGQARTHANDWSPQIPGPKGGIGLAMIRLDGFVSRHAAERGGFITTKLLRFTGSRLEINASTASTGGVRVEIQDSDGRAISGFTLDDSREFIGDEIAHAMQWNGKGDVGSLAGKPVRLRFEFRETDLFAFRFVGAKSTKSR